jgi:ABC-2 type transport system permease protein
MSARVTLATARRVLWQIRRDPRTIALLLVVPVGLLVLMRFVFDGQPQTFQAIGAPRHLDRDAARAYQRHP